MRNNTDHTDLGSDRDQKIVRANSRPLGLRVDRWFDVLQMSQIQVKRVMVKVPHPKEGGTFISNEPVPAADLKDRLAKLAMEDPARIVYVRGDRTISYAQLMDALGLVNGAGFTRVSLVAEGTPQK